MEDKMKEIKKEDVVNLSYKSTLTIQLLVND